MSAGDSEARREEANRRLRRIWTSVPLWGIYISALVLAPILLGSKLYTYIRRRRSRDVARERWTLPDPTPEITLPGPETGTPHLVFGCMSIGEASLVRPVARRLSELRPDLFTSLCIGDPMSLRSVREANWGWKLSYMPFDCAIPVAHWLKQNHPDTIAFVDRISAKLLVAAAAEYGSTILLINGQSRDPKRFMYRMLAWLARWTYRGVKGVYMQYEEGAAIVSTYAAAGAEVRFLGDLKGDMPPINIDPQRAATLEKWLSKSGGVPIFVAGSTETHDEETLVLEAYRKVRSKVACRLLLAPRSLARIAETLKRVEAAGLTATRRTENGPDADVYVLDTLGELAYAYQFGVAAWVGGFVDKAGHNVLEPLRWGVPFAIGMRYGNFKVIVQKCEEAGVGKRLGTADALAAHWEKLLTEGYDRQEVLRKADLISAPYIGSIERTVEAILRHLPQKGLSGKVSAVLPQALAGESVRAK